MVTAIVRLVSGFAQACRSLALFPRTMRERRRKPRILLLADCKGWAFDNCARQIARCLRDEFRFTTRYVHLSPKLSPRDYDLIYVFFWGETYFRRFGFDPATIVKELSSHRWEDDPQYGPCSPSEMADKYLAEAATVVCTSRRLFDAVATHHPHAVHAPNGVDTRRFRRVRERAGVLTIGWAGNVNDPVKGVADVLRVACGDRYSLLLAEGGLSHARMNEFYNQLDVLAVTSKHEGSPLTLLEGMAAGCFPVCSDVGIVPEVIRDGRNGLIVGNRRPEDFRAAFAWCEKNLTQVREAGSANARWIAGARDWKTCAAGFGQALWDTVERSRRPRFRNDDVSADTSLERFQRFSETVHRHGIIQVNGITLRGCTNSAFVHNGDPAEYAGCPTFSKLPNSMIRRLSDGARFEDRTDLVEWLRNAPDEIALHGLYHVDYSAMALAEQREDMEKGLALLRLLFPGRHLRYFIAPFNRTNGHTYEAAAALGLTVLAAEGIHLEERLHDLAIQPRTWHRYHHHRFYPESTCKFHELSLPLLDRALARNAHALSIGLTARGAERP